MLFKHIHWKLESFGNTSQDPLLNPGHCNLDNLALSYDALRRFSQIRFHLENQKISNTSKALPQKYHQCESQMQRGI